MGSDERASSRCQAPDQQTVSVKQSVSSSADSLLCGGALTCLLFLFPQQTVSYLTLFVKAVNTRSRYGMYRPAFRLPEGLLQTSAESLFEKSTTNG